MTIALPVLAEATRNSGASPFPTAHRGRFIKQFQGPEDDSGIVCFKFWQLVHASGCPFSCAYCFLQTTTFFRFHRDALSGLIYENWRDMLKEVQNWLQASTPRMMIVGELQDGLAFENAYAAVTGRSLAEHLVPLFAAQERHKLIFLTKSTLTQRAMRLAPTPQVVFSWSVNAEYAARRWELGAPPPSRRFAAAMRMKQAGWSVRVRLDPMIPYAEGEDRWQDGYAEAVSRINALRPEMVTIGALRASTMGLASAAKKNGRPAALFGYLSEKDPSGFKYRLPFGTQVDMYRFVLDQLDRQHITPALCKEDLSVWREAGLAFKGCHCLLQGTAVPDEIVSTESYARTNGI